MYRSLRPIFDRLYRVLGERFTTDTSVALGDSENARPYVPRYERGVPFLREQLGVEYPLAFLEWGRVSDIELYQSPEEYAYVLTYRLFYLIQLGVSEDDREGQIFRESPFTNPQWGVGEFAQDITNFFWQTHQPSRFSEAWEGQDDWSILDLTVDGGILNFSTVTDQTLDLLQKLLLEDLSLRAVQINFSFEVREREGFA